MGGIIAVYNATIMLMQLVLPLESNHDALATHLNNQLDFKRSLCCGTLHKDHRNTQNCFIHSLIYAFVTADLATKFAFRGCNIRGACENLAINSHNSWPNEIDR